MAAARTLNVLEFIGQQPLPVPGFRISAACGIPRSTPTKLLRLLKARGYVAYRASERGWAPGHRTPGQRPDEALLSDGLAVLEALTASASLSADDVAPRSGLPRDVTARLLAVLARRGLVIAGAGGTFVVARHLTAPAFGAGWAERLQRLARPVLVRLRNASGETASLLVEDAGSALYLDQAESRFQLRCHGWVGRHVPLEGTSLGRAFADPSRPHAVADAVDVGVTAITCAVSGLEPAVGVSVIGPTWRLEERGLAELSLLVSVAARELADACATAGPRVQPADARRPSGGLHSARKSVSNIRQRPCSVVGSRRHSVA